MQHDPGLRRDAEHIVCELLDDQDRDRLALGDLGDDLVEALDDDRREAHRELVDHEHGRVDDERAGERQHLLLTARQRAGELLAPFARAAGTA